MEAKKGNTGDTAVIPEDIRTLTAAIGEIPSIVAELVAVLLIVLSIAIGAFPVSMGSAVTPGF